MNYHFFPLPVCFCGSSCKFPRICTSSIPDAHRREPSVYCCDCCFCNSSVEDIKDSPEHHHEIPSEVKRQTKRVQTEGKALERLHKSSGSKATMKLGPEDSSLDYEDESSYLDRMNEQFEEKIRDLERALIEHDIAGKSGADLVTIRKKIRALLEQSRREKKQFRKIIADLRQKLEETGDEVLRGKVNFLREKIEHLLQQQAADCEECCGVFLRSEMAQKSSERVLTRSCEDLKIENERIQAENEALRRAMRLRDVPETIPSVAELKTLENLTEITKSSSPKHPTLRNQSIQPIEADNEAPRQAIRSRNVPETLPDTVPSVVEPKTLENPTEITKQSSPKYLTLQNQSIQALEPIEAEMEVPRREIRLRDVPETVPSVAELKTLENPTEITKSSSPQHPTLQNQSIQPIEAENRALHRAIRLPDVLKTVPDTVPSVAEPKRPENPTKVTKPSSSKQVPGSDCEKLVDSLSRQLKECEQTAANERDRLSQELREARVELAGRDKEVKRFLQARDKPIIDFAAAAAPSKSVVTAVEKENSALQEVNSALPPSGDEQSKLLSPQDTEIDNVTIVNESNIDENVNSQKQLDTELQDDNYLMHQLQMLQNGLSDQRKELDKVAEELINTRQQRDGLKRQLALCQHHLSELKESLITAQKENELIKLKFNEAEREINELKIAAAENERKQDELNALLPKSSDFITEHVKKLDDINEGLTAALKTNSDELIPTSNVAADVESTLNGDSTVVGNKSAESTNESDQNTSNNTTRLMASENHTKNESLKSKSAENEDKIVGVTAVVENQRLHDESNVSQQESSAHVTESLDKSDKRVISGREKSTDTLLPTLKIVPIAHSTLNRDSSGEMGEKPAETHVQLNDADVLNITPIVGLAKNNETNGISEKECDKWLQPLREEVEDLTRMNIRLQETIGQRDEKIEALTVDRSVCEDEKKRLIKEINELQTRNQSLSELNTTFIANSTFKDDSEIPTDGRKSLKIIYELPEDIVGDISIIEPSLNEHESNKNIAEECEKFLEPLRQEIDELKRTKSQLENELLQQGEKVENLTAQLLSTETSKADVQEELKTLKDELGELVDQLNVLTQNKNELNISIESLNNQLKDLQEQLSKSREDNVNLRKLIVDCQSNEHTIKLENDKLKEKIANLVEKVEYSNMDNNQIKHEVNKMMSEFKTNKSQVSKLKDQHLELPTAYKDVTAGNKSSEDAAEALPKIVNLQSELQALENELIQCRVEKEELEKNLDGTKQENSILTKQCDDLKNQIDNFKSTSDDFQRLEHENEILKMDNITLSDEKDRLRVSNSNLKFEVIDLKNNNDNLHSELDQLKYILGNNQSEILTIETTEKKLSDELSDATTVTNYLKAPTRDLSIVESQVHPRQLNLNAIEEEKLSSKHELSTFKLQEETHEIKHHNSVSEIKKLNSEVSFLKNELKKCLENRENLQNELDQVKQKFETLKIENKLAKSQLKNVQGRPSKASLEKSEKIQSTEENNILPILESDTIKANVLLRDESTDELNALKDTLAALNQTLHHTRTDKDQMHRELKAAQRDIVKNNAELYEVKKSNEARVNQVEALNRTIEHLTSEISDFQLRNNDIAKGNHSKILEINEKIDKSRSEKNSQINSDLRENIRGKALKLSIQETEDNLNKIQDNSELIKSNKLRLSSKDSECCEELEGLKKMFKQVQSKKDKLEAHSEILEKKLNKLEKESEETGDAFKTALKELNILREHNKTSIEALKAAKLENKQEKESEQLKNENNQLKNDLKNLNIILENYKIEKTRLDNNVNDLKRVNKNNELYKNDIVNSKQLEKTLDELNSLKESVSSLKNENNQIKQNLDYERRKNIEIRPIQGTSKGIEISDVAHEFVRALDVLRMKMELQIQALAHIRANLKQMKSHSLVDLSKLNAPNDRITLNSTNPIILEIHELSDGLTASIEIAARELASLSEVWKDCWKENLRLRKLVKNPAGVADNLDGLKLQNGGAESTFHPEKWLQSLTLTQLADLHDRICLITSSLIQQDTSLLDNQHNLQQNCKTVNRRIAALQRQITAGQNAADSRVEQMHKMLCQEQAELNKIKNEISKERKRNLILQFSIANPCLINNCTAPCAQHVKFISH